MPLVMSERTAGPVSSMPAAARPHGAGAGLVAVAAAAALWAIAAIVARDLFDEGVVPLELAEARAVIAAAGFLALNLRAKRRRLPVWSRRAVVLTLSLGLAIALVNGTYYLAIERLSVAVAVVLQYTAPVLVVVWTALVGRRPPSPQVMAALIAAVAGVVLVVELPGGAVGDLDGLGIAFGLASAVLFASYSLLSEQLSSIFGALGAMARAFLVASGFWVLYQIPFGWPGELFEPSNIPEVLFVGLAGTLSPFLLYVWGIRRVRAERATIAATLEPVLAAVFAWMLLGQSLGPLQIAGGLLACAAVVLLQVRRRAPVRAPEP
jgi:DME family drug/metabolite transporter